MEPLKLVYVSRGALTHNYIACNNLAAKDSFNSILFAVEYSCRTFMCHHLRHNC